jgi:hypothetical protein
MLQRIRELIEMRQCQYHQIMVSLPPAVMSRLAQSAIPDRTRLADWAVELIRIALFNIFPPHTPAEWNQRARFEGICQHLLHRSYSLFRFQLRAIFGEAVPERKNEAVGASERQSLKLIIPAGLMKWVKEIARIRQSTIPEATVYAIEYGLQELTSRRCSQDANYELRQTWREIFHAIRKRS